MQQLVAIDPQLGFSAKEFVEAWNQSDYVKTAKASVKASSTNSFISPELSVALISAAASVPATIIASFISEYLKKKFLDKESPKITQTTIQTPDGSPILIIKKEEKIT